MYVSLIALKFFWLPWQWTGIDLVKLKNHFLCHNLNQKLAPNAVVTQTCSEARKVGPSFGENVASSTKFCSILTLIQAYVHGDPVKEGNIIHFDIDTNILASVRATQRSGRGQQQCSDYQYKRVIFQLWQYFQLR